MKLRLDSAGTLRYGTRTRMEMRLDSTAAWLLEQTDRFLAAWSVPAEVGKARPGRHPYRGRVVSRGLPGPSGRLRDRCVTAVLFGASAAATYGPNSGPVDSQARGQARWTRGIV